MHGALKLECGTLCRAVCASHRRIFIKCHGYRTGRIPGILGSAAVRDCLLYTSTINDAVIRNGKLRADGALVHDMLLLQVKAPAESKAPWDYYHVKAVLKGDEVFPLSLIHI